MREFIAQPPAEKELGLRMAANLGTKLGDRRNVSSASAGNNSWISKSATRQIETVENRGLDKIEPLKASRRLQWIAVG